MPAEPRLPGETLSFFKLHGLGNDFLLFEGLRRSLPLARLTAPELAQRLCHRHRGVGGDGLLLLLPPQAAGTDAWMRVINADGSEAEMCGNGIRCAAKVLADHLPQFHGRDQLLIQTGAGNLQCQLRRGPDGAVQTVRVDMGRPRLERQALALEGAGSFIEQPLSVHGRSLSVTAVSMGNPHLISFDKDPQQLHALASDLGPLLERHPLFPDRTNVAFAAMGADGAQLVVWERGCGLTQACGTGACATAVAAVATGRWQAGQPLDVHLPGGTLRIEVEPELARVWMEGPAVEVFRGEITI